MSLAARAASIALWVWDVAADDIWMTEARRALRGFGRSEPITFARLLDSVHPDERHGFRSALEEALRQGSELGGTTGSRGPTGRSSGSRPGAPSSVTPRGPRSAPGIAKTRRSYAAGSASERSADPRLPAPDHRGDEQVLPSGGSRLPRSPRDRGSEPRPSALGPPLSARSSQVPLDRGARPAARAMGGRIGTRPGPFRHLQRPLTARLQDFSARPTTSIGSPMRTLPPPEGRHGPDSSMLEPADQGRARIGRVRPGRFIRIGIQPMPFPQGRHLPGLLDPHLIARREAALAEREAERQPPASAATGWPGK